MRSKKQNTEDSFHVMVGKRYLCTPWGWLRGRQECLVVQRTPGNEGLDYLKEAKLVCKKIAERPGVDPKAIKSLSIRRIQVTDYIL